MVSFLDSLVAPMGLMNALIVAVGVQDREQTHNTFRDLEKIWKEYGVYQINED
jgi:DNA-binding MurR/RpiR family transcriptional regulator